MELKKHTPGVDCEACKQKTELIKSLDQNKLNELAKEKYETLIASASWWGFGPTAFNYFVQQFAMATEQAPDANTLIAACAKIFAVADAMNELVAEQSEAKPGTPTENLPN